MITERHVGYKGRAISDDGKFRATFADRISACGTSESAARAACLTKAEADVAAYHDPIILQAAGWTCVASWAPAMGTVVRIFRDGSAPGYGYSIDRCAAYDRMGEVQVRFAERLACEGVPVDVASAVIQGAVACAAFLEDQAWRAKWQARYDFARAQGETVDAAHELAGHAPHLARDRQLEFDAAFTAAHGVAA